MFWCPMCLSLTVFTWLNLAGCPGLGGIPGESTCRYTCAQDGPPTAWIPPIHLLKRFHQYNFNVQAWPCATDPCSVAVDLLRVYGRRPGTQGPDQRPLGSQITIYSTQDRPQETGIGLFSNHFYGSSHSMIKLSYCHWFLPICLRQVEAGVNVWYMGNPERL